MKMLNQKIIVSTHHISYFELSVDFRPLAIYTPWIALISCDKNSTGVSMGDDIFTFVRNHGAIVTVHYLFFLGSRAVHLTQSLVYAFH